MYKKSDTVILPIDDILPDPGQPRKNFDPDALSSLAQSLRETGLISPVVVRPGNDGKYMIVVGERRWRASKEAELSHLECIIREDIDEQKAREMQFTENYQRDDVPPLEQARSLKDYLGRYSISQSELSRRTGIPQRTISNRLTLLSLPASLQAKVEAGSIGPYEALKITKLPVEQQGSIIEAVSSGKIGGRELEKLVCSVPQSSNRMIQEPLQMVGAGETNNNLAQRLKILENAICRLAACYAHNEATTARGYKGRRPPPCPECLKKGDSGYTCDIRRKMTLEERREWIEWLEEDKDLDEDEREELLEENPTHIIEVKCHHCGYDEFLSYDSE